MQARLDFRKAAPDAYQAVVALDRYVVRDSGLEPRLIHLIKIRASQINGCAYCVDMHIRHALADGLSQQWINMLPVWQESPLFDARERALLEWTEALTLLADTRAPDAAYEAARVFFSEEELTKLTVAIGLINVWNRVAVGFRTQHPIEPLAAQ
ncbi:alkyl hydroperoxide reductase AhpD [Youhaiella tibetensis]|uniref:Carboxymuconolactone decarboxylase family protein n=1 Tax=Paradevosia tibetensis TaxID=1447062 RepID=A0A5B9DT06_9HYPH|nr:carboxymuconolactone decarboxylase family protein [Youhaiella tibetensis]AKR57647.1 alkylhydroperoxidase [Devosia sp. H5989]QEE22570.1 carboxymuconolactone decarboxylase family protein [Youhaiella tibetensis]GGF40986.1 alkyl hydroperoxide reductase AhpD [Youhaiella tibetensis]